ALNQIWKIAKYGCEEMELIHYAMVGGLSQDQLPLEDRERFQKWFEQLPEFKKHLFNIPSLENILNAHADELLETTHERFIKKNPEHSNILSATDTQLLIKTSFQCLTKIDDARAVRNRMTIQEIADIIQQSHITVEIAGKVLDVFKEQGNTFIKPFI